MTTDCGQEKLAYKANASAYSYGAGGHVMASFLCASPEKARRLVEVLLALAADERPPWATADAPPTEVTK